MADASKINYDGTEITFKDASAVKQVKVGTTTYNPSNGVASLPAYPTVNNGTLTIQKNGTNVQTFSANESGNKTANITMSKSDVGLGNVGNFKAVSTVANQGLTEDEKGNARSNIGAGSSSFSGDYNDLSNKPTIPTVNNATLTIQKNGTTVNTFTANASSNVTANITMSKSDVGLGNVGNFKAVSTIASQGLTDTEKSNARANIGAGTSSFSGSYTDLTNKPTIPTVNNATLTIQKNGTNVQTFTANSSSNKTANITVPTKVSELTNDSGYTTNTGTVTQVKVGSTAYNPTSGVVSLPAYPTVNNATLTIQKNGTNVQTFTANSSTNKTANITVPTKVSELTNDSNYLKNGGKGKTPVTVSLNQQYVFPEDGYCSMMSGSAAGSTVIVALYGTDGVGLGTYFLVTPVAGYGSSIPFYVKKGMKVVPTRIDSGSAVYASPVQY